RAAAEQRLFVGYVGASYEAADCQTLEREARQAAIDDARSRAEIQAALLGVQLGDVIASSDVDPYPSQAFGPYGPIPAPSGGCEPQAPPGFGGDVAPAVTLPPFDPTSQSDEVEVYRQLRITFAIEGQGAPIATPE
ncbi:MAG TPA: SIMPL domain-containing protein, partial [Thermomicrobiales bacterium]|nr:SIMPL domain-containing protein [Thermomicrobiales bacterium]